MSNNKECAQYFKSRREYQRAFRELRNKWKSYGKVSGNIILHEASDEERRAIGGILGKVFYTGDIRFSFAEFEKGLQRTRFAPVDMQEVLEEYFGETLSTNQGLKREEQEKRKEFLEGICEYFLQYHCCMKYSGSKVESVSREDGLWADDAAGAEHGTDAENTTGAEDGFYTEYTRVKTAASLWLQDMIASRKYGYQILIREYVRDRQQAETLAKNVGTALIKLELGKYDGKADEYACTERTKEVREVSQVYPLAVFAAGITGNPHYFDRGTTAGLLFVHALCHYKKSDLPETAHQWRELLWSAGIVPDNISSMVHAYGLRLRRGDGYHPAYDAFCSMREPYVITMENLRGIIGAEAIGNQVYVVENEMVFSYLLDNVKDDKLTLLCTSGQPRTVAMELIPLILNSGAAIFYSGDIDPDGVGIADRLWQKFGDRLHIWRMSPADYEKSVSEESIADTGVSKLENIKNPLLRKTAECIKEKRKAAYQENLLEDLLWDVKA